MGFKSVVRGLVARWGSILLVSLLGGLIAYTVVRTTNDEIQPRFKAEAAVQVPNADVSARESVDELDEAQAEALELAQSVNSSALLLEGNSVRVSQFDGSLVFTSTGRTAIAAISQVEAMRAAYVAADENFSTAAQLEENLAEANRLTEQLEELTPTTTVVTVPAETPDQIAASAVLQARENAIRAEISSVTAVLLDAGDVEDAEDPEEIAELEGRLDELEQMLEAILAEQDSTQDRESDQSDREDPEPDIPMFDLWSIQAIENRLAELQALTGPIIIDEIRGTSVELSEAVVVDETASPLSMRLWLSAGLLAGALLAASLVLIRDRSLRIIWHPRDLMGGIPVVAEGPAEPETASSVSPKLRLRRRKLIQAVRSAILAEPSQFSTGSIVGLSAVPSTSPHILNDLSYEVGSSMAWVGRSVLVINVGFSSLDREDHAAREGTHLHELVGRLSDGDLSIDHRVTDVLSNAASVIPGLDILFADLERVDPVDLLDGKPFRRLLERSVEAYDVVILVTPSGEVASTARITSSFQQEIIVATLGRSSVDEVEAEFGLESSHQRLLRGVVIVRRRGGFARIVSPWLGQIARRAIDRIHRGRKKARSLWSAQRNRFRRLRADNAQSREEVSDMVDDVSEHTIEVPGVDAVNGGTVSSGRQSGVESVD